MGTQNQTPGSQARDKRHSGIAGKQARRHPQPARAPKGKDAGNVPHSDDDIAGDSSQGPRDSSDRK